MLTANEKEWAMLVGIAHHYWTLGEWFRYVDMPIHYIIDMKANRGSRFYGRRMGGCPGNVTSGEINVDA